MPQPTDKVLYKKIKKTINKKHPKHSAYRSGLIVKKYKETFKKKYGNKKPYKGKYTHKKGLNRWFNEKWRNQRGEVGYKYKSDVYRPTLRITKKTPVTFKELTEKQIKRARREKKRSLRIKRFKGGNSFKQNGFKLTGAKYDEEEKKKVDEGWVGDYPLEILNTKNDVVLYFSK